MKYAELVVPLSSKPGLPIQIALVFFCEKSFQWYWQSWEARRYRWPSLADGYFINSVFELAVSNGEQL
jgi:hypothetical protein